MALAKFVVTNKVTVAAGTATLDSNGFGVATWAGPSGAWAEGFPVTFYPGQIVIADSSAGSDGPQLLYQAIGAGNLRAYSADNDSVGHAAISN